jgi:hypothetical protein
VESGYTCQKIGVREYGTQMDIAPNVSLNRWIISELSRETGDSIKMHDITFVDKLSKMHNQGWGKLLAVDSLPFADLSPEFKTYDSEEKEYGFGNSMVIVLTFQGQDLIPFTTVRRGSAASLVSYRQKIGQPYTFNFSITEAVQEAMPV